MNFRSSNAEKSRLSSEKQNACFFLVFIIVVVVPAVDFKMVFPNKSTANFAKYAVTYPKALKEITVTAWIKTGSSGALLSYTTPNGVNNLAVRLHNGDVIIKFGAVEK